MTKKTNETINQWKDVISNTSDRDESENKMLNPSRVEMRYIVDYAKSINEYALKIEFASDIAHQNIVDMEMGQKIIDHNKKQLLKNIENLKNMLEYEEELK